VDELTDLLLRARAGNEAALEAFVRRSQPEIWRFCAHLVGTSEADDAAQETYLAAWRALPSFRDESSARTWLFVIARRTALRAGKRQVRLAELDRELSGPGEAPSPEYSAVLGELIGRLEENRRLALILTQVHGLSYAEAAEVCGCALGTIRSRVARAREDLISSGCVGRYDTVSRRRHFLPTSSTAVVSNSRNDQAKTAEASS
jgi:RNA polymerase sigma-70 factor (ECF subfamily)